MANETVNAFLRSRGKRAPVPTAKTPSPGAADVGRVNTPEPTPDASLATQAAFSTALRTAANRGRVRHTQPAKETTK